MRLFTQVIVPQRNAVPPHAVRLVLLGRRDAPPRARLAHPDGEQWKMRNEDPNAGDAPAEDMTTAVGIVVQDGTASHSRPHLAFVWGPEVRPAPSLPFGRWKTAAKAA